MKNKYSGLNDDGFPYMSKVCSVKLAGAMRTKSFFFIPARHDLGLQRTRSKAYRPVYGLHATGISLLVNDEH